MMRRPPTWLVGPALGALFLGLGVGCSNGQEESGTGSASVDTPDPHEVAELDKILGNDRVGRAYRAKPSLISAQLPDFEDAFGVGRACKRVASKEIFIIEEKSNRFGGKQQDTLNLEPRAVIGGCNMTSTGASLRPSFELFVAAISDKSYAPEDPFSVQPVEAMALDETTGLYNFYIMERPEPSTPHARPTVTRFIRRADGEVMRLQKVANRDATIEVSTNRKCFDCHIHGGPVMNELTQPWTGWVSSSQLYSNPNLTGISRELVSEARPFRSEHGRSSLANDLEKITRAAIATWVEGLPEKPGSGLGPQVLSGEQPGGVTGLLKSVLCETELNFASASDTVPFQMFVDDAVADFVGLQRPLTSVFASTFPLLLPTRAETDKRIEVFLQKKRILRPDTVLAARLVDDEHDIFSTKRCGLHPIVATAIAAGATPEAAVVDAIKGTLSAKSQSPRERLIAALLDPNTSDEDRDAATAAYTKDITARFTAETAKLESAEGLAELDARLAKVQKQTQVMFPSTANMLPRLQHVPALFVPVGP